MAAEAEVLDDNNIGGVTWQFENRALREPLRLHGVVIIRLPKATVAVDKNLDVLGSQIYI